jgi:hypothetical protein
MTEEAVKESTEETVKETVEETVKDVVVSPLPKWMERWFRSIGWFDAGALTLKPWKVEEELVI